MDEEEFYNIVQDVRYKVNRKRLQQCNEGHNNKELAKLWGCSVENVRKWKINHEEDIKKKEDGIKNE